MRHMSDVGSISRREENGQADEGLGQPNPSLTDEIVRRGQEALDRKRRSFDDWLLIAEALEVGRAEIMAALHTNRPTGKRYEHAMGKWLLARGFHVIDKCTRSHLLECLKHRAEIGKWRDDLKKKDEFEHFRLNHPTTVLRKWKAEAGVPGASKQKNPSPMAKLKEANIELQEKLYRAEKELARGGGDLWTPEDTAEAIAGVMLDKLTTSKAERVARAILSNLKERKKAAPSKSAAQDAAMSAEERKALFAGAAE